MLCMQLHAGAQSPLQTMEPNKGKEKGVQETDVQVDLF